MMPLDMRQPRRGGYKRRPFDTREDSPLYQAVLHLRRSGRAVYRCGSMHKVDGAHADSGQLLTIAMSLGWRP